MGNNEFASPVNLLVIKFTINSQKLTIHLLLAPIEEKILFAGFDRLSLTAVEQKDCNGKREKLQIKMKYSFRYNQTDP